jgi:hypothetical protein
MAGTYQEALMKNRIGIVVASLCIALTSAASAIQLGDFVGTWSGQRTETRNGSGTYSFAEIRVRQTASGGLAITEIGESEMIGGNYIFKHSFKAGGKYQSTSYSSGYILATNSGTWSKSGNAISISGTQSSSNGKSHFSGLLKLVSKRKITYSGKSGGITVKISAKRS